MADNPSPKKHARRSRRDDPKMIGCWKLGKTIGKGSSGRVKIARHTRTGQYAAVKIVSKQALITSRMSMTGISEQADKILLSIEREIVLMKLIDHPNILSLYDVWETSSELYLILEYVQNGELFDYLVSKGRLSVEEALQYFQQIISAVDYCHRFNIAHRDLKPENLLLDRDNNIKVADFGMAAWEGGVGMLETSCGSPHYASPEVVQGKAYKGCTSDIWSCGVILYALLVGRLPFDDENIRHLLEKVKRGKYVMPDDIPLGAQHLLSRMLETDVDKRITVKEILVHPWFTFRPPKSLPGPVIPPPTLDMMHRPIGQASDIDPDIFSNLRTLWHGAPEDQTIAALLNHESTWEKAVYHLLLQYRARRLEDYDAEEEQGAPPVPPKNATTTTTTEPPIPPAETVQPLISLTVWNATETTLKATDEPVSVAPLRLNQPAGPRPQPQKAVEPVSVPLIQQSIKLVRPLSEPGPSSTVPLQDSPKLPPISQSELGGESIRQFFSQAAHPQLRVKQPNSSAMERNRGTSPIPEDDDERFADAEEDHTSSDGASLHSSIVGAQNNTPQSGRASPSAPNGLNFGLGISNAANRTGPSRAFPRLDDVPQNAVSTRRTSPLANARSPPIPMRPFSQQMDRSEGTSSDKENATLSMSIKGRPRAGTIGPQSAAAAKGSTLERRRTLGDRRIQIVLPGEDSKLRKRQSVSMVSETSDSSSGFLSSPSPADKPTWFANLFKFKPATFNLLSVYDAYATRDECRRLLTGIGVSVTIENGGNLGCRFDGVSDPSGVMEGVKPVRFRVEIHGVIHLHSIAGFKTSISLIQEKGALSSFKLLYNRLRREWDLDTPIPILKTPHASASGFTKPLSPHGVGHVL